MNPRKLLVDPLAALFRNELAGLPPLLLDETEIDVQVVAPLAVITIARRFTNTSAQLIEAVLTLPPLAPGEILYRLIVRIGGVAYHAMARPAGRARRAHDAAIADGRRAILYELLAHDIPMLSIAGIEAGAQVEISTWSIRPLARPDPGRATLQIRLSAASEAAIFSLPDADAPITTPKRHAASLTVSAEGKQVTISGQPYPDRVMAGSEAVGVECSTPIFLTVIPLEGGTLDHAEWHVDKPGGWEVTSERGVETFRHPANPDGSVASDRTDWIFGAVPTVAGCIRVTAPLPTDGTLPNAGGLLEIAPNARGMRAFAAAGFVETATPQDAAAVRLAAGILDRRTSLAFIGPLGELPDEIPMLHKLALAEMEAIDFGNMAEEPIDPDPFRDIPPPARPLDLPPPQATPTVTGPVQSLGHWLTWAPILLIIGALGASFMAINLPFLPLISIFTALMLINARRFLPPRGAPVRARLPLLAFLALPWVASLIFGPIIPQLLTGDMPDIADWMIPLQYGLLAAAVILPCALIAIVPGARRFALVLGLLNLVLAFFLVSASIITLSPGS